ncbi:hypothetical protein F5Y17DRAFT_459814 [Xylariaceae sp. FL0594]|nr:hypothetical protein F5Y17DRAFT_459814 [Xylariaceae sp. FL0594]
MSDPKQSSSHPPAVTGQFAFLAKIGATPEAVATLNDQPYVFFVLVSALGVLGLEKPEQKNKKTKEKKKKSDEKKPGGKPPAQR